MRNLSLYLLTLMIWSTTWLPVEFQIPENGALVAPLVSVVYRYLIAAFIIFSWRKIGANRAGYITIVTTIIAVVISVVFEGLEVTTLFILGVVLVLVGNLSILNSRQSVPSLSTKQH